MKEWRNQYMAEWPAPDPGYLRLRELVLSYLNETEDYDQRVCSGRCGKLAMPINGDERRLMTQYARACMERHLAIAREERLLDNQSWIKTQQRVYREWEREYVPPNSLDAAAQE